MAKFGNELSFMHNNHYLIGLEEVQKMLLKVFLTFGKKSVHHYIAEHKEVERQLDVSFSLPNDDFIRAI